MNGSTTRHMPGASGAAHVLFALLVTAAVWLVFYQVGGHDYLNLDDDVYILRNPHVLGGLTWENLRWAFTKAHEAYWLPLTWVSFMLDVELFGARAGPQLLVNVALHSANVLLLYALLVTCTGKAWVSAWVAAIFALHPLRMESVAWVSQRKDVLSMLFWLLAVLAYVRYARGEGARRARAYALSLVSFAIGLLAKPTVITLPVVLLLLDHWPLARHSVSLRSRIVEKLPFFVLAGVASLVTIVTQSGAGAVPELGRVGLEMRLANSAAGYLRYVGKLVYPADLAVFYPLAQVPTDVAAGAAIALLAATASALYVRRSMPYVFVGWLWYVVTLLPVIGLLQVGGQAVADRYTYIPSIGLTMAVAWWAAAAVERSRAASLVVATAAAASVVACAVTTYVQLPHWRDSIALFERAVAVTEDNFFAHNNLGEALMRAGRVEEAGAHYQQAVAIHPRYPEARNNYGTYLARQGRYAEAEAQFRAALEVRPTFAIAESNVATARARLGDLEGAATHYQRALEIDPYNAEAHYGYGDTLMLLGRPAEALLRYESALALRPDWAEARAALERARKAGGNA